MSKADVQQMYVVACSPFVRMRYTWPLRHIALDGKSDHSDEWCQLLIILLAAEGRLRSIYKILAASVC